MIFIKIYENKNLFHLELRFSYRENENENEIKKDFELLNDLNNFLYFRDIINHLEYFDLLKSFIRENISDIFKSNSFIDFIDFKIYFYNILKEMRLRIDNNKIKLGYLDLEYLEDDEDIIYFHIQLNNIDNLKYFKEYFENKYKNRLI